MTLSDLIAVMRDGKVVQLGTTREIYRNPRDLYVATFVGQAEDEPRRRRARTLERRGLTFVSPDLRIALGSPAALGLHDGEWPNVALGIRAEDVTVRAEREQRFAGRQRSAPRSSCSNRSVPTRSWSSPAATPPWSPGSRRTSASRSARRVAGDPRARAHPPVRSRGRTADHPLTGAAQPGSMPPASWSIASRSSPAGGRDRSRDRRSPGCGWSHRRRRRPGRGWRPEVAARLCGRRGPHAIDLVDPAACRALIADVRRSARPDRHPGQRRWLPAHRAGVDFPLERWDAILADHADRTVPPDPGRAPRR